MKEGKCPHQSIVLLGYFEWCENCGSYRLAPFGDWRPPTNPPQQRCAVEWPEKWKTIIDGDLEEGALSHEEEMRRRFRNEAIDACITAYNAVHGSEREGEK